MPKQIMVVHEEQFRNLQEQSETGMGFQIFDTPPGLVAVLANGIGMPYYSDPDFYNVDDLLEGMPIQEQPPEIVTLEEPRAFADRASALTALRAINISSQYTGTAGAFQLIAYTQLPTDTVFYRYLSTSTDPRYVGGSLKARTYLTAQLDTNYANSGFATVGRYALPIPLPSRYVIQYELQQGTTLDIGTVAPAFGQAGGGVEVRLRTDRPARQLGWFQIPEY